MRLIFELTQKCNMRCKYCHADKTNPNALSIDTIENVCKEVSNYGDIAYITLTGGESFVYNHIEDAVSIAHKYTSHILLLTNGLLLDNEKYLNLLKKFNIEVQISLDSIRSNYHDEYRGNQTRIINNILDLKRTTNLEMGIVCVISSKNITEIPELISFSDQHSLGLDFELMDIDRSSDLSLEHLSQEEIGYMLKMLSHWGKKDVNRIKYKLFKVLFEKKCFKPSKCFGCRNTILICSDGTVCTCFHNKSMQYGNVSDLRSINNAITKMKDIFEVDCFSYRCIGNFF